MNDYYLLRTGKDITADRIAEANRSRLARSARRTTRSQRPGQHRSSRATRGPLSGLLHRVAFF